MTRVIDSWRSEDEFYLEKKFGKVPIGWEVKKIHSIATDIIMGQSPSSDSYNSEYIGLPYVQGNSDMGEIYPNIRVFTSEPKKVSDKNDILVSVRAPVGELFINNLEKIAIGRGFCAIRIEDQNLANYFFQFFLYDRRQFKRLEQGTTFTEIGQREVRNLQLPLPPPPEQRAIASVLSKVDDAITATKKTIAKAEWLKKALMRNLLTGRLKPDGTWRTEDEFYVDEKFGRVPIDWRVLPIKSSEVCRINPNYDYQNADEYPFVPMEAMSENFKGIEYFNRRIIENSSGLTRFKNGDILFAKITPCTENGKATYVQTLETDIGFASTEFIVFSPTENIDGLFLFYRMLNDDIRNLMVSLMEGTTGRQRVPTNIFKRRVLISYPEEKSEQIEIIQPLNKIDLSIKEKEQKIQKLERLKKALMQNLLTGKVRLKPEYIQEFADG